MSAARALKPVGRKRRQQCWSRSVPACPRAHGGTALASLDPTAPPPHPLRSAVSARAYSPWRECRHTAPPAIVSRAIVSIGSRGRPELGLSGSGPGLQSGSGSGSGLESGRGRGQARSEVRRRVAGLRRVDLDGRYQPELQASCTAAARVGSHLRHQGGAGGVRRGAEGCGGWGAAGCGGVARL